MSVRIEMRHVISAAHLKNPVLLPTKEVESRTYFKVSKGDQQITRLLVQSKYQACDRPLSRTDVVERLVSLRNSAYHSLLMQPSDDDEGKEDLGLDGPPQPRKAAEVDLPASLIVQVPDVEGVLGIDMRIELCKTRSSGLWVELTTDNINFLIAVVNRQIASGEIKRQHARDRVDEDDRMDMSEASAGVSYSYKRSCVRARGVVEGKQATKYFKFETPELVGEAIDRAEAWSKSSIATE
jgi:hypothetical protein